MFCIKHIRLQQIYNLKSINNIGILKKRRDSTNKKNIFTFSSLSQTYF